jgi:hypothetical protein
LQGLQQRISVPDQLASLVGRALAELLPPLAHEPLPPATPTQRAKEQECWEVDFVEQVGGAVGLSCSDSGATAASSVHDIKVLVPLLLQLQQACGMACIRLLQSAQH